MTRRRLDRELLARGLAASEEEAGRIITQGRVLIDGVPASKTATLVDASSSIRFASRPARFVSRAGEKLAGALEDMGIDPTGLRCLDVGAGTGGFTDCLVQTGASEVVAVDVSYGLLDWRIRNDARVKLFERTNIRTAEVARLGGPFDLVVADLSFISLEAVLDKLVEAVGGRGLMVLLVKPQFEAPRESVPTGGVVKDPEVWRETIERVGGALEARGWGVTKVVASHLLGAEGNQEFFVLARLGAGSEVSELAELADRSIREVS